MQHIETTLVGESAPFTRSATFHRPRQGSFIGSDTTQRDQPAQHLSRARPRDPIPANVGVRDTRVSSPGNAGAFAYRVERLTIGASRLRRSRLKAIRFLTAAHRVHQELLTPISSRCSRAWPLKSITSPVEMRTFAPTCS